VKVSVLQSVSVTWNERGCLSRFALDCQFAPQFRFIDCQPVLDPLIFIELIDPAPPTFRTRTRLNQVWPFIVNLIPPLFTHETLQHARSMSKISGNVHTDITNESKLIWRFSFSNGEKEPYVPLVPHWYNPGTIDSYLLKSRLSHIKMLTRRVAPPTVVAR
jgi:hypothetical protein